MNKNLLMICLGVLVMCAAVWIGGCEKKAADEPQVAESKEQTQCPVMGGAVNKELFVEYKGQKVYFCCPGCEESFNKEPEKYVNKLPQFQNNKSQ